MALENARYDPRALMQGLIPIQREGMIEDYLKEVEPMWVIATCQHDLSVFGNEEAASLIGFHWMEHLCPEIGSSAKFLQEAREMLFNSTFLQANEVDQFKKDHLLKEMLENNRAGWEMFYLLCRYLQIPAMFFLHQGVYVTQDGVLQPQNQRVIFVCGLMERLRVLRPSFHNMYGLYSWTTDPVLVREIMSQGGGKGKGKKSSSGSKRKRREESLIERTRAILGESMEEQGEQPPAKRMSLSGDGEPLGSQAVPPAEIAMVMAATATVTTEAPSSMEITVTATTSTSGSVAEPVPVSVVSEGKVAQASTGEEADPQEPAITMVEPTATTSTVSFVPGELHRGRGVPSQSSGASRESFISTETMLIGRGRGRGVRPTEAPATAPRRPESRGASQGPQPGTSGESGGPAPGPSGDPQELRRANENIRDLESQVDSLVGIQNNLEIEMETQRVLVQEYEEDIRKLKHDNATVKAQLLTSDKKNATLQELLLKAEGQLREAGSAELEHWRDLAESRKNESNLLEVSLVAYKRALSDQVKNYQRLRMYTHALEKQYQEAALSILMMKLPCPDDLLPQVSPLSLIPLPANVAAPVVVTPAARPVVTVPSVTTAPPTTETTPTTTVTAITTTSRETTVTMTATVTSQGEAVRVRASGSGVLRATMVNRPLVPGPTLTNLPVVFPTPARLPIVAGGTVQLTRVLRQAVPSTSGIIRPLPRVTPVMPIRPASVRARMSTAVGVMSGGVVTPSVPPALRGRGQVTSPARAPTRDEPTTTRPVSPSEDVWATPPAVPVAPPQPVFRPPVAGLSTSRQRTPGKTRKRKDPSPSKVRGHVEPDEGSTPKEHFHVCPECPNSGYISVVKRFAEHMHDVHDYLWVCPVCGRIQPDKGKLNFHMIHVHGEPGVSHKCFYPGCGKSFSTAQYLIDHLPIHGREHACHKCGHGHRKRTDRLDHERCCDGPFNRDAFEALRESTASKCCDNCGRVFMQVKYTAHLEACNQKYLEKRKGKRRLSRIVVAEEGRSARPQEGELIAGLPSMFASDTPPPTRRLPTLGQEPSAASPPQQQGELPQGLSRVEGRHNVATSKRKPRKESSVAKEPEVIELHSSDKGNGAEQGGPSTPSHAGGQGARARYFHQQRIDQIFEEEG